MADIQEAYPTFTPSTQAAPLLLGDFDTIRLSQSGYTDSRLLEFVIVDDHGTEHSHTETYYPVDCETSIHDVRELLLPYFNRSDIVGLTGFSQPGLKSDSQPPACLILREYAGESLAWEQRYDIVYTDSPTGCLHTGLSSLGSRFLVRENRQEIGGDEYGSVSWFGHGELLKVKLLHYSGGIARLTQLTEVSSDSTHRMQTYNFTLRELAAMADVDVDDVIYADFQLFLGDEAKDCARFTHNSRHRSHERQFAFIGAMGEPEFLTMTGSEEMEAEFEGTFLMEHNEYRKASTTLHKLHKSYTGPLSEGQRDLVWDMAASPWVYTIEDGELVEVTITEVALNERVPRTEPIGLSVKWRYSDEYRQRTFRRDAEVPHIGVFDKSFEEMFE